MIKRNLMVSLNEAGPAGEQDVLTIKTTSGDNILIEVGSPKMAVNPKDLEEAIKAVYDFLEERSKSKPIVTTSQVVQEDLNNVILYGDDEASNS